MTKQIRFTAPVFDGGLPRFKPGDHVPHTPEAERWVRRGVAEVVDVEEPKAAGSGAAEEPKRAGKRKSADEPGA